jgi:FkbM family methyltransferase
VQKHVLLQTVLEMFSHLIHRHPDLASDLEKVAAFTQGKGYGAATIEQEVNILDSLLKAPPFLAVDIGGNVGNYTAELCRRYPELEIHTFEPAAVNVKQLLQRFAENERIHVVPLALSDTAGSAVLYSNEHGSGLGSLSRRRLDHFNIPFDKEESVYSVRFEEYWHEKLGNRPLDMVKLDVEGHELSVLKGFGDALKHCKAIQFEFGGCNIDTRTFFQDFWYFFQSAEFDIYRITPHGAERIARYKESDEFFSTTNYVAVNKNKK